MEYVRSKRKFDHKLKLNINKQFLEFYGALMGDGCLSKVNRTDGYKDYCIIFSGHKILDRAYYEKHLIPKIKKEFDIEFKIKDRKYENGIDVKVKNKSLLLELNRMGFPIGKKGQKLCIPKRFLDLDWEYKKFIVRGLFDTDGCISARKDEGYKYPHIMISSKSNKLINQLYNLLKERGYPVWITKRKDEIRIKGIKNAKKWMKDIGSSNYRHLKKYNYWIKKGVIPVNNMGA